MNSSAGRAAQVWSRTTAQVTDPTASDPARPNPRLPAWLGDVLGAVLVVSAALIQFPETEISGGASSPTPAATIWLVVAAATTLLLRRRWPLLALIVCIGVSALAAAIGIAAQAVAIATALAMYSAANSMTRRWTVLVGGASIAAIAAITLLVPHGDFLDPRFIQFPTLVGLGAALGDATRSRREYGLATQERAERAEQTREAEAQKRVAEERLRIARDLHDTVAHQISVISLNAGVASTVLHSQPERAIEALGTVRHAARTVLGEIGDLLYWLRSEEGATNISPVRPQPTLGQLDDLISRFTDAGLRVDVHTKGDSTRLPDAVSTVAYRTVQEGLTNAHRHGGSGLASLRLDAGADQVKVVITNPVSPRHAEDTTRPSSGYGLVGLRERIAAVRGTVEAGQSAEGYTLAVTIPLPKESAG